MSENTNSNEFPKLYTMEEVANILRVSSRTVKNMVKSEKIKAIKIGHSVRITHDEINRLLGIKND